MSLDDRLKLRPRAGDKRHVDLSLHPGCLNSLVNVSRPIKDDSLQVQEAFGVRWAWRDVDGDDDPSTRLGRQPFADRGHVGIATASFGVRVMAKVTTITAAVSPRSMGSEMEDTVTGNMREFFVGTSPPSMM